MIESSTPPRPEEFGVVGRKTGALAWVRELKPGEPTLVPEAYRPSARGTLYNLARYSGFRISIINRDGEMWVMRLLEDAK